MNMKCKHTRLPLIMAAVLVSSVLGSTAARAQTTPGAIPDPGTYQGSTQIQQEQDRQAQQYRQQPAQPFQPQSQQPQGSYPGRAPGTSNAPSPPDCLDTLARQPELAPLAQKVYLGHTDTHSSALFDIQTVPTASERPLLLKWSAGRRNCLQVAARVNKVTPDYSAQAKRLDQLASQIIIDMIGQLAEGKLTYGQFNRQRTKNALVVEQTP
jgi:hypothetical protein